MPVLDIPALIADRTTAIRELHTRLGCPRAELDLSGGVDSAVLLGLLAQALGPEHITTVFSSIHSSTDSRDRARAAAEAFHVPLVEIDLTPLFDDLIVRMRAALISAGHDPSTLDERIQRDPTIIGSIRSCIRAPIGRGFNRMTGGGLRHGTGNECEDRWLRFFQKGGDGEVDTNPIAMLSKGEVYQLAKGLGVPRSIVDALPSPDLHGVGEAHNDEAELLALSGVAWTYSRIDWETGAYTKVGTIELLSRFLDLHPELFAAEAPSEAQWRALADAGEDRFRMPAAAVLPFLVSARKLEAGTRHKANPNCPSLGERSALLSAGVLSDQLPAL